MNSGNVLALKLARCARSLAATVTALRSRSDPISSIPASLIPLFLVSWFPDSFLFSLMNYELVSVGVAELRHPANWRLHFLNVEADATLF